MISRDYVTWPGLREIHKAGAVLVRPDGYIVWRHDELWDEDDALEALRAALHIVLDKVY